MESSSVRMLAFSEAESERFSYIVVVYEEYYNLAVINEAIKRGLVETILWLTEATGFQIEEFWHIGVAAMEGQHEVIKWLKSRGYSWNECMRYAVSVDRKETILWLRDNGCPWNGDEMRRYAGDDLLNWLQTEGF